jgi:type III pantothenate kinase
MYLTLDIGNTRSKFARFDAEGRLLDSGFWETALSGADCKAVCIANVTKKELPLEELNAPVVYMSSRVNLPFTLGYQTPEKLGADRLAAAVGAAYFNPNGISMVVDAGTCLKFEYINKSHYEGGSISPGLMMRYKALATFTDRLPEIAHRPFVAEIGDNTETSILSGVQQGFLLEVEGRVNQFLATNPGRQVFLTGGDSPFLAERLKTKIFAEPLLLHYGLYHTLRLNGY